jgi:hypothetical protein
LHIVARRFDHWNAHSILARCHGLASIPRKGIAGQSSLVARRLKLGFVRRTRNEEVEEFVGVKRSSSGAPKFQFLRVRE